MDVIKDLGIYEYTNYSIPQKNWIYAEDIRAAIEKLPVVYGFKDAPHFSGWKDMDKFPNKNPSHQARLIGVEKLVKKPVKLEKVIAYPKDFTCYAINGEEFGSKLAGKKVKVVFEEVIE